jgi:homoserine dehydrogenase
MRRVNVGLLGCGTVGRGFVELLGRERERIRSRHGVDVAIRRILVRDAGKQRTGINPALVTTSAIDVLDDGCDIIVELVGGVHAAGAFVRRALRNGHDVVTANKALLADAGRELFATARTHDARIGFEASVCGGIPIIGALQRGLAGDRIDSITGILNGTCNYILTRMEQDDLELADALQQAQAHGFAEADPMAAVRDETNAVVVRGRAVGEIMFQGKGAGSLPTAAAVLADVVGLAQRNHNRVLT